MQIGNFSNDSQTKTDELSRVVDLGPPLPSDLSNPPWRPRVAGLIAFFFGPVGGALVVVTSLRRMGYHQRAGKIMLLALAAAAVVAAILFFIPETLAGLVGFGTEIAFLLFFPVLMEGEFNEWQATHPDASPSNGWRAIGWGLVGTVLYLLILVLVFFGLSALAPAGK